MASVLALRVDESHTRLKDSIVVHGSIRTRLAGDKKDP